MCDSVFSVAAQVSRPVSRRSSGANPGERQRPVLQGLLLSFAAASGLFGQTQNSSGCIACHGMTDTATMHPTGTVYIGCVDCHGGNAQVQPPVGTQVGSGVYEQAKRKAHLQPNIPE